MTQVEKNMREITVEDMEKIQGAGGAEAKAFLIEMFAKYGVDNATDAFSLMTRAEVQRFWDLMKNRI